jgi:iron(III) transport system permease protein
LFAARTFPGRRLLTALLTLPVALPPLVGVVAFLFLYGESGFLARAVMALLDLATAPWRLEGFWAILLVHAYSMYVYFFLFTRAALLARDPALEEAAAALGASRARTFRRVTLPLLRPALAGASLLVFLTSLASFSAPYLFGGNYRVMTTQIVASKLNGDDRMALAESLILAAAALAALALGHRLGGARSLTAGSHGRGRAAARALRGVWRPLVPALAWAAAAALLLPHLTLLLLSLVPAHTWTVEAIPPVLSLDNWRDLVASPRRLEPLWSSAWMATLAAAGALGLGLGAALTARRRGRAWRSLLEGLLGLPWAIPGTVFAVALAATFSVSRPGIGRFLLIGTPWLLPLAYLLRSLPLTGRAAVAGLSRLDPALEEASAALGASPLRTLRRITLPLVWPALAAGLSLAFISSLGDFVTSILLYTYSNRPIAIEILATLRLQETGMAAAYGVVLMALSTTALVVWGGEGRAG